MSGTAIDDTLKSIFQRVFEASPDEVTDQTRRGALERWDSLGHLELLEALQVEFKVEIPPEQGLDMETVADVKRIIAELRQGTPSLTRDGA